MTFDLTDVHGTRPGTVPETNLMERRLAYIGCPFRYAPDTDDFIILTPPGYARAYDTHQIAVCVEMAMMLTGTAEEGMAQFLGFIDRLEEVDLFP